MGDDERKALLGVTAGLLATNNLLAALTEHLFKKGALSREEVATIFDRALTALEVVSERPQDAFYGLALRHARQLIEHQARTTIDGQSPDPSAPEG